MRTDWQRVRDVFERTLEARPANLDAWLAREAADSPDVSSEVRSLLDHHSRAGSFLAEPPANRFPSLLADDEAFEAGRVIGPYTIVRELGRGGMGRVYLATAICSLPRSMSTAEPCAKRWPAARSRNQPTSCERHATSRRRSPPPMRRASCTGISSRRT